MKLRPITVFLLISVILAGCRSTKNTSQGQGKEMRTESTTPDGDAFDRLTASYGNWSDVNVPISIHVERPTEFSISGRATLVRGKSIDMSLRVLGFEMGRALITNDSLFVVIKPQRTYIAESLDEVTKYVSFSTENIQDLLTGRPFLLGAGTLTQSDRKAVVIDMVENGMIIKPRKQPSKASYGYAADTEELITKLIVAGDDGKTFIAEATYGPHTTNTPAGVVASQTTIDVSVPPATYSATIGWKWNSAKWNTGVANSFNIPQDYRRTPIKELLKSALPK